MRVLHILDHSVPLFSGYSFRSQSIIQQQRALGIEPVVLTSPKHGSKRDEVEEIDGLRYYRTQASSGGGFAGLPFLRELALIRQLARRIGEVVAQENIEVLHCHSPSLNGLAGLQVAARRKLPLLYEARAFWEDAAVNHGTFAENSLRYRISRAVETFLIERATGVVTICEGMRQDFIGRGIAAEKIQVVPNGVNLDEFKATAADPALAQKFGLDGAPVFGFIGSFYKYEGLRFLIDAVPALAERLPGVKLLLVGGGYDEAILKNKARELGNTVIFTGQVPHQQITGLYSLLDVFVCPREKIRLTDLVTPLKPLEAMSMGKMVLASDVGGHREMIEHERTGLLFNAGSTEDFVRWAVRAASDAALRQRLSEQARRYVESERSWAKIVSRYPSIYGGLCRAHG